MTRPINYRLFCCATLFVALVSVSLAGCKPLLINNLRDRLRPSNHRDWRSDVAKLPHSVIADGSVAIYNIRNSNYISEKDYIVSYYDREFPLNDVQTVDFVVAPFRGKELLAHTF